MQPVLDDYRTAPIDEKLRAMLGLLETLTLHSEQLDANRVREVLDTGVTREQIRDAFYVAFLFNTYDRLADTLGIRWNAQQSVHPIGKSGAALHPRAHSDCSPALSRGGAH